MTNYNLEHQSRSYALRIISQIPIFADMSHCGNYHKEEGKYNDCSLSRNADEFDATHGSVCIAFGADIPLIYDKENVAYLRCQECISSIARGVEGTNNG